MKQTTKLSTKGQIVVPKSLRAAHRWKAGTEFVVQDREGGIFLAPRLAAKSGTWEGLIGCLPYSGPRKSLREMEEAIATEARSRK
jgi:AbrB family looped-hinge helix DNA binding protein